MKHVIVLIVSFIVLSSAYRACFKAPAEESVSVTAVPAMITVVNGGRIVRTMLLDPGSKTVLNLEDFNVSNHVNSPVEEAVETPKAQPSLIPVTFKSVNSHTDGDGNITWYVEMIRISDGTFLNGRFSKPVREGSSGCVRLETGSGADDEVYPCLKTKP